MGRVVIYGGFDLDEELGSVTLRNGEPIYSGDARVYVEPMQVVRPALIDDDVEDDEEPLHLEHLTPADGEEWLKNLARAFTGSYVTAAYYADGRNG